MPEQGFFERVYEILRQVPPGFVATYGQIAALMGEPRAARTVGYAMRSCPEGLPWHRVTAKDGNPRLPTQKELLEAEGVSFLENGSVDMKKHGWMNG